MCGIKTTNALFTQAGNLLQFLHKSEVYGHDREERCRRAFSVDGIAHLLKQNNHIMRQNQEIQEQNECVLRHLEGTERLDEAAK